MASTTVQTATSQILAPENYCFQYHLLMQMVIGSRQLKLF